MTVGATIGVEEEYSLVFADTGALADRPDVVDAARAEVGTDVQGEISTSQLEIATPVCRTLAEVRAHVVRLRAACNAVAERAGCRILATGTHPTASWRDQRLTPGVRYLELYERWGLVALQQMITGCHVHVSVDDQELQVRVMDRLRPDLPVLLALAASSPYWEGVDTGYASYRTTWFGRWPVTGTPDVFGSRAAYDELVAQLVAADEIDDPSHLYWDVRPSTRFPTLEVRVADTCPSVDDVVLHTALARSLVRVAAADAVADVPPVALRQEVVRAARWRASKDGLEGRLLDQRSGVLRPAAEVVGDLLVRVRDDLEELGDREEVEALAEQVLRRGTSAARQRATALVSGGDLRAVTLALLEETARA